MSTQKHQIGSRVNLLIVQVPGGLSNFIRRLAERLKENTVSEALKLMLASFTLFFQGETWRRGGWNSVEWWGLLHHHQSWVNFALPACYCYSSFGSSSGRNTIHHHHCVFHIITLQGKPQEAIPTKSGKRSSGGVGEPWLWQSQQSLSGMGLPMVERRGRISQDRQIKVRFVQSCTHDL